ncbi:MAG: hypothetical protein ACYS8X_09605 [Planctomycetota bacterium]|jgi:hypothetical protein
MTGTEGMAGEGVPGSPPERASLPFNLKLIGCAGLMNGAFFGSTLMGFGLYTLISPVKPRDLTTTVMSISLALAGTLFGLWFFSSASLITRHESGRRWTIVSIAGLGCLTTLAAAVAAPMAIAPLVKDLSLTTAETAVSTVVALIIVPFITVKGVRYLKRPHIRAIFVQDEDARAAHVDCDEELADG